MQTFRPSRAGFARPLDELRDEFDRLWTTLTTAPPLHGWGVEPREGLFPAVNISEREEALVVEAEVPGLDAADIDVAVTADELVLKGNRPEMPGGNGEAAKPVTWLRRERGTGAFERRLPLPVAVDATRVEAKLVDGVLTITCPKSPESQPHKIEVRTA